MKLHWLLCLVLCLMLSQPTVAQINSAKADPPGTIDGAKTPELISDETALALLLRALNEPEQATELQKKRSRALARSAGLGEADTENLLRLARKFNGEIAIPDGKAAQIHAKRAIEAAVAGKPSLPVNPSSDDGSCTMRKLRWIAMSAIICTKITMPAFAQAASAPHSDLQVSFAFLNFQNALAKEIESRMASNPDSANSLRDAATRMLKVSPADFDVVSSVASSAIANLGTINEEMLRYRQAVTRRRHKADFQILQKFQSKRSEVILSAMT
ncbi:MAG: hypothetical protein ACRD2L_06740, partial [Terriglobia bacterium]